MKESEEVEGIENVGGFKGINLKSNKKKLLLQLCYDLYFKKKWKQWSFVWKKKKVRPIGWAFDGHQKLSCHKPQLKCLKIKMDMYLTHKVH